MQCKSTDDGRSPVLFRGLRKNIQQENEKNISAALQNRGSFHPAEKNASQKKHNRGKKGDDAEIHVKRMRVDSQECAAHAVNRVTEGIDFHQSMQPGGQSFIYREEGAGKEKKRKNQKGGNDLEPFQTFQERTQGQAQRHQGDRRDEQDQRGRGHSTLST